MMFFFNKTPLHKAVEIGNTKIVKLLLNHKDIDANILDSVLKKK